MIGRHFAACLLVTGLLVGASVNPGLAQTRQPTQSGMTQGAAPASQAPVGHRQPRADEVPPPPTQDQAVEAEKKADERLQKVLQSICRGC